MIARTETIHFCNSPLWRAITKMENPNFGKLGLWNLTHRNNKNLVKNAKSPDFVECPSGNPYTFNAYKALLLMTADTYDFE